MGLARIDFGSTEVKERKTFKPLADGSKVLAEAVKFEYKKSSNDNPMIAVTYKVTDENAKDVDGGTDFGNVFDNIVFSEGAAKMTKLKLLGLGYEVDDLVIETTDDVKDLVEDLKDNFLNKEVILVIDNQEWNDKVSSKAKFINRVE